MNNNQKRSKKKQGEIDRDEKYKKARVKDRRETDRRRRMTSVREREERLYVDIRISNNYTNNFFSLSSSKRN